MTKDIRDLAAEDILQSGDVDKRIAELEAAIRRGEANPEEEDTEELTALLEFRGTVTDYKGVAAWNNGMWFVSDSYWDEYAEDEAESLYGKKAVQSGYFNVEKFADALTGGYREVFLDYVTFWYRT